MFYMFVLSVSTDLVFLRLDELLELVFIFRKDFIIALRLRLKNTDTVVENFGILIEYTIGFTRELL